MTVQAFYLLGTYSYFIDFKHMIYHKKIKRFLYDCEGKGYDIEFGTDIVGNVGMKIKGVFDKDNIYKAVDFF